MKKILLYAFISGVFCSCSDFLKESSQDLMIPKSVKDYKEFLYGEGLNNGVVLNDYLEFMTDDVADVVDDGMFFESNDWRETMWGYYTWQQNPEIDKYNAYHDDPAWYAFYHKILVSNIILDKIAEMEGTEQERNDLAGEAYFLRAYSYFTLVNSYGEPFDAATADADLGVPINLDATIQNVQFSRSSVAKVYSLIESDIRASIAHFKNAGISKTIFRPNLAASYLMASRVALFQEKYTDAVKYADSVEMVSSAQLCDLNNEPGDGDYFLCRANPEVLFSQGGIKLSSHIQVTNFWTAAYITAPELVSMYKEGRDLRLGKYYLKVTLTDRSTVYYAPYKWYGSGYDIYPKVFRLSEVYLNRAEAYAETGQAAKAIAELNTLRQHRFSEDYEVPAEDQADPVKAVRDERRMELAFEGFRWFDLRRWGCPRIEHRFTDTNDTSIGQTYVLEKGSASYTLPVPKKELDKNLVIENIVRPESNPL